ncbi:MAG: RNA polymerase sigma factor [Candidatus Limnocylindrales bacterium]
MDDDDLLRDLARDLDGAFESFVRAHADRCYSIALRFLGDSADAEEVAQDAFVRAHRALGSYGPERIAELRLRAWLATIVINLCRSRVARHRLKTTVLTDAPHLTAAAPHADSPHERLARRESAAHWAALVAALPARYRAAVVLRHVDGLSYEEMSEVLGRPEGTIRAQVHRGLALLRAAFEAAEREESIA